MPDPTEFDYEAVYLNAVLACENMSPRQRELLDEARASAREESRWERDAHRRSYNFISGLRNG